ncbi:hypothetical protein NDN08_003300 [Rhodosorus marinus]|uniref:BHLH domain-containing protein n=1 Tax=Rhodosorus marinus TaxID=101924 RepID=A0AAV8UW84_9RHOD|nr:hypothetical protein NDN08_003300 [Rhodosorus marinus]
MEGLEADKGVCRMEFSEVNQFIKEVGRSNRDGVGGEGVVEGVGEGGGRRSGRAVDSLEKGRMKSMNRVLNSEEESESRKTTPTRKRAAEDWASDKRPATFSSGGSENEGFQLMSIPERKREREKRRRECINLKFSELCLMLPRSANGRLDKEGILVEALDSLKTLNKSIMELNLQNQNLKSEMEELRQEKVELRTDKNYLRAELDAAREEIKTLKADHLRLWHTLRQQVNAQNGMAGSTTASDPMLEVALRAKFIGGGSNDEVPAMNNADTCKVTSHNECA